MNSRIGDKQDIPLITIGLLTYNNQSTIDKALQGLVKQTYSNYELLIFDDCSTDNTVDLIKTFCINYLHVTLHVNKKNLGIMKNFELLLKSIQGEYFFWACPDDLYSEKLLSVCFSQLHKTNMVAVLPSVQLILGNEEYICNYRNIHLEDFLMEQQLIIDHVLYKEYNQYCLYWHSLIKSYIIKKCIPFYPNYLSIEEIFPLFLIMHGGIATAQEILWSKHQSLVSLKIRNEESYNIAYGFLNKYKCCLVWAKLYLKSNLTCNLLFIKQIFMYLLFYTYTQQKSFLYKHFSNIKKLIFS